MSMLKLQMPNSKHETNFKVQNSKFKFGFWILFGLWILGFGFSPKLAFAKTLQFHDQSWEINNTNGSLTPELSVRAAPNLGVLAKNSLFGSARNLSLVKLQDE